MFGNGSDGALNVASGTTNLLLDTKYQYTTVNVASGATLSTSSTAGSVLYILATTSIVIDGNIFVKNSLRGQVVSSVTIDGVTYTAPGTSNGGNGGDIRGGVQNLGFGGGGTGGRDNNTYVDYAGYGGAGGLPPGTGGAANSVTVATGNGTQRTGPTGGISAGGAGGVYINNSTGGSSTVIGGAGGDGYGQNGSNGSGSSTNIRAGGGGGGGGQAGTSGVHIVLKSPIVNITGLIRTSDPATNAGGTGGNGGNGYTVGPLSGMYAQAGSGGGGGGGGNGGNVFIFATTYSNTGTIDTFGGYAGNPGTGYFPGGYGGAGIGGDVIYTPVVPPADYLGPFVRTWDGTSWIYAKTHAGTTSFVEAKVKVL